MQQVERNFFFEENWKERVCRR